MEESFEDLADIPQDARAATKHILVIDIWSYEITFARLCCINILPQPLCLFRVFYWIKSIR